MSDTTATTEDRMAKLIHSAINALLIQPHLAEVAEGGPPC
jgi:hypothetical protein